jgi:DNA-binding response OmpR family regulator
MVAEGKGRGELSEPVYRILVVDDESSVCQALVMGFASHEFTVDVTTDGESAIQLGCTGNYDVLIADLGLPDMNGMEVIQRIKERHPEIVPIVITAHSTEERCCEARQNGVAQLLEKPFTLKAIRAAVREALAQRYSAPDGTSARAD